MRMGANLWTLKRLIMAAVLFLMATALLSSTHPKDLSPVVSLETGVEVVSLEPAGRGEHNHYAGKGQVEEEKREEEEEEGAKEERKLLDGLKAGFEEARKKAEEEERWKQREKELEVQEREREKEKEKEKVMEEAVVGKKEQEKDEEKEGRQGEEEELEKEEKEEEEEERETKTKEAKRLAALLQENLAKMKGKIKFSKNYITTTAEVPLGYDPSALQLANGSWISGFSLSDLQDYVISQKRRVFEERKQPRYLTYVPTDGFANQVVSFAFALGFAFLTERTLVVPPILGHFEGPARGNCKSPREDRIHDPFLIRDAYKTLFDTKLANDDYVPFTSVLDISKHSKYVPMIDARELEKRSPGITKTGYIVPEDCCVCQNTVWLPFPLILENQTNSKTEEVTFLAIDSVLKPREEQVLDLGVVYFPSHHKNIIIFNWPFQKIFTRIGQLMKTVPYSAPITTKSKQLGQALRQKTSFPFYDCIHIRVQESLFSPEKASTLSSLLQQLREAKQKRLSLLSPEKAEEMRGAMTPVLVLSDTEGPEFEELVREIRGEFQIFRLMELFQEEIAAFQDTLSFSLDPMHLEAQVCACADHFFGTKSSTFSRRITSLRGDGC